MTNLLAKELHKRGHILYTIGVSYVPLKKLRSLDLYQVSINGFSNDAYSIKRCTDLLEKEKIDVIINQCMWNGRFIRAISYFSHYTPIISCWHFNADLLNPNKSFGCFPSVPLFINKLLYRIYSMCFLEPRLKKDRRTICYNSKRVVLLTKKFIPIYKKLFALRGDNHLTYIYNPLDNSGKNRRSQSTRNDEVLSCCRLDNIQKRIDLSLSVWSRFNALNPNWHYNILGTGHDEEMLKQLANNMKLKNCRFCGYVDNPESYYEYSKILMVTSDYEGWGMNIIEAMYHGCVPVVYNHPTLPYAEIITDKVDGMLIAPDDEQGFVVAMEYVKKNFERMSAAARESVKKYDISKIADSWEQLLKEVVAE